MIGIGCRQLTDDMQDGKEKKIHEIETENTTSHSVENSLWKRL